MSKKSAGIKSHYDIAILGGGINGCALAAEAQSRGLSVILIEKSDLASGTSSSSSQLIHGGLRYLEQGAVHLVMESLREQAILLRRAPHLVHPLNFILPHSQKMRPAWAIRFGLWCYDHLVDRTILPRSRSIRFTAADPLLPHFQRGFMYADCLTDDARLVISNALLAAEHGATILSHCNVTKLQRAADQWTIDFQLSDNTPCTLNSHIFINATGAWIEQTHQQLLQTALPATMSLSQGSHFVLRRHYSEKVAYLLQNHDRRVVFVIPWHGFTLVGTTDTFFQGDPATCAMTAQEEAYLCETISTYFKTPIDPADIIYRYSGVRALFNKSGKSNLATVSREGHFTIEANDNSPPLVLLFGGKITTHRHFAEQIVNKLADFFPGMKKSLTAQLTLPGGDLPARDMNLLLENYQQQFPWLPPTILARYLNTYGTRTTQLLANCQQLNDMGKEIGIGLFQREVDFLYQHEWANSLDDVLWRRTKLGLQFLAQGTIPARLT